MTIQFRRKGYTCKTPLSTGLNAASVWIFCIVVSRSAPTLMSTVNWGVRVEDCRILNTLTDSNLVAPFLGSPSRCDYLRYFLERTPWILICLLPGVCLLGLPNHSQGQSLWMSWISVGEEKELHHASDINIFPGHAIQIVTQDGSHYQSHSTSSQTSEVARSPPKY